MTAANPVAHRVAVNTLARYSGLAITTTIGFFLVPFLIHTIGKPAYGLQALSSQVLQFVGLAAGVFGMSYERFASTHYARGDIDQMNATLSVGLSLASLTAGFVLAISAAAAALAPTVFDLPVDLQTSARAVLLIMGIGSACSIVNQVWRCPIFIKQIFYVDAIGSVLSVVPPAIIFWCVAPYTTPSIVFWVLLGVAVRACAEWFCIIPLARRSIPEMKIRLSLRASRTVLRSLMGFSLLSFIGGIGYLLFYATDAILIVSLQELGVSHVADYNVAQRWDPQIRLIVMSFIGLLTPMMISDAAVGDLPRVRSTIQQGTRYGLIVALFPCLTLTLLSQPFLATWLGPSFSPASVPVLQAIMLSFVLSIPGIVGYEALFAHGRIREAVFATLGCGLLNLMLGVALVKFAGLELFGIALGTAISLLLLNVLIIPGLVRRHLQMPVGALLWSSTWRVVCGAIPMALLYVLTLAVWQPQTLLDVFLLIAVGGLLYLPCVWFLSFATSDRERLRRTRSSLWQSVRTRFSRPRGTNT